MPQTTGRFLAASSALAAITVACTAIMVFRHRLVPARPDVEGIRRRLAVVARESGRESRPDSPRELDLSLFSTLIPAPTPTPAPTPAPPIPPGIATVIANWRLAGMMDDVVFLRDERSRLEWQMRVGEGRPMPYGSTPVTVRLDRVDTEAFAADFSGENAAGVVRKSLFDE